MTSQGQNANYRPGVNRAITKKWAEAKKINYDDWDDSDGYDPEEPVHPAPGHARQQSWDTRSQRSQGAYSNPPGQYYPSNRSVTGPASSGRPSFDRGDDRRHFSNVAGSQGPYPTAQRDPFQEIQHDYDPQMRGNRGQPSLQLETPERPSMEQGQYQQAQYPQGPYTAGPRGNQFQEPRGGPFSAPIIPSGRRSQSSGRPAPGDLYPRGESPMPPGSQNSQSPSRAFPPRKSSLSQQQPPPEIQQYGVMGAAPIVQPPAPPTEAKALPFIRPADIYKRMEEEREKERRSQESSRPSFESATSRIRESSVASHRTGVEPAADQRSTATNEEPDTTRRTQPTLPPVAERKSEYGLDNMMQNANQDQPAAGLNRTDTDVSKASAASSDYTNRPDPTSASTLNSRQLPFDASTESPMESPLTAPPSAPFLLPDLRGVSDFGTNMFGQPNEAPPQPEPQLSTMTSRGANIVISPIPDGNLQHQNSLGYRSMVNQAFDQSQQVPPTPISMSDSVARSNSASASDISPIVGRNYEPPASQSVIPEESNSRPGTSGTQQSVSRSVDKELPPPPAIIPGYRRDSSPATSSHSAKRPLSITTAEMPKSEHATPSAATSSTASWDKDSERSPERSPDRSAVGGDVPVMAGELTPLSAGASSHLKKPSELSRTASEDWREWESSRKQFKSLHGVQDSMPSTPGVPSPISRSESPSKGTVRDIASKLENSSGMNSPVTLEAGRPTNARLESFRPSIPGGWQSYTTNTGAATPQNEMKPSETHPVETVEEDDSPRAGPPKDHSDYTGTSKAAFEALAASGSALAGAFGMSQAVRQQSQSRDTSEENSRTSTSTSNREADETPLGQDRQLESIPEGDHRSPASPLPPTPLPKDTPSEVDAGQSTLDYFPAPLAVRQSRGAEKLTPLRPTLPPTLSTETSPQDDENDILRKEIVKSLTPKSSLYQDTSRLSTAQANFPTTSGSQRTVSTMGESNLPSEYDSYWNESNEETDRKAAFEAATPIVPPVPETFEATTPKIPPVPETKGVSSSADADIPPKTILEQRFSWETAGEQTPPASNLPPRMDSLQGQGSPDTIKVASFAPTSAPISATTSTPAIPEPLSSSEALRPAPSAKITENKGLPQLIETRVPPTLNAPYTHTSPSSNFKERAVKDVFALNSPKDRIQAFNAHRQHYATNDDGGLSQWLQTVGSSRPEHAAVMSANGIPTLLDDGTELHRPSPARLGTKLRMPSSNFTGSGETSGTKQMQQDGKRLLQAGGKLGKKGGLAAKGLLAKAKDKARAVSSSDKGVPHNRRRSSQFAATPIEEEPHSSYPSAPPQIPKQKLEISPVDHDDWSLPYGTPRDNKKPDWEIMLPAGTEREVMPNRLGDTPSTAEYEAPQDQAENSAAPAPFIGQVIPSNEEQNRALRDSTSTIEPLKADHQTLKALEQTNADPTAITHESRVPLAIAASVPIAGAAVAVEQSLLSTDHGNIAGHGRVEKPDSLAAPQDRHSMISNVSTPSPNPADTEERSRSISPPRRSISNQTGREDANAPPYTQHFPPTKAAEAEQDRGQAEEPLPIYEQPVVPGRDAPSRLGENPQIVPVADLSSHRREGKPVQARPFSFAGPESLERMSTDTPRSPAMGNTLEKQGTNVSVDEVNDDSDGAKNRKSFHRPFGVGQEPAVHEHPAYRNPDLIDRSRMYSTENPLPSARRDQASPVPGQRPAQQRIPQEGEEGYRIPGPYVQEYRSPTGRQNITPFDTRQGLSQPPRGPSQPVQGPPRSPDRPIQPAVQPNMAALHGRDMGPPPKRPEQERPKSRTFGGLFKREKSHATEPNKLQPRKERRESFFKGRQDSISSQGSRLGSLRQTPSREQPYQQNSGEVVGQRRLSKDMLRSAGGNDDEAGRKKRFSGMGGFFGKSGGSAQRGVVNTQQNAPMQQSAYQDTHQGPREQAQSTGPSQPPRLMSLSGHPVHEQPYHLQTTQSYRLGNAGLGGYDGANDRRYPNSAFPHGPDSVIGGPSFTPYGPGSGPGPGQGQNRNFTQSPNPSGAYSAGPGFEQQRPQDLRINTGPNSYPNPKSSAPAPAAARLSPASASYVPSTRAPNSSSAGSGVPASNRAIDLHKRSRSPKLGRRASSEDLRADPAANLGTFSSKSRSPNTANAEDAEVAQEKPWAISLPTDADEASTSTSTSNTKINKVLQRSESAGNRGVVAELPGSKANGYESEEEIVMSATAMPGEMWAPDAMDYAYGKFDD